LLRLSVWGPLYIKTLRIQRRIQIRGFGTQFSAKKSLWLPQFRVQRSNTHFCFSSFFFNFYNFFFTWNKTQTNFFFDTKSERHKKQDQEQKCDKNKNKNETKTQTWTQQDTNKKTNNRTRTKHEPGQITKKNNRIG